MYFTWCLSIKKKNIILVTYSQQETLNHGYIIDLKLDQKCNLRSMVINDLQAQDVNMINTHKQVARINVGYKRQIVGYIEL